MHVLPVHVYVLAGINLLYEELSPNHPTLSDLMLMYAFLILFQHLTNLFLILEQFVGFFSDGFEGFWNNLMASKIKK